MRFFKEYKGITLIALIVTVVVLLILAGVTINAISGSESAPAKANESSQKNDIGTAKDDISLTVVNAKMQGMENAYVENGVSKSEASKTVGQAVINSVLEKNGTNVGKATIEVEQTEENDIKGNASISIYTTDFVIDGTITLEDGVLTWGEIEPNVPSIKIANIPETLGIGKTTTLNTEIKRVITVPTVTWSTNDETVATINNVGVLTGIAEGDVTITATITVNGTIYKSIEKIAIIEEPIPQINENIILGDAIEGVNGETNEDDWKILCYDEDKQKVYAILDSCLPVTALPASVNLETQGTYYIYKIHNNSKSYEEEREEFITELIDTDKWRSLVSNTNTAIKVYGALPRGNSTTEETMFYAQSKRENGYFVPSNTPGIEYWLASADYSNTKREDLVYCSGNYLNTSYTFVGAKKGVCPIAILPYSIVEKDGTIWKIKNN